MASYKKKRLRKADDKSIRGPGGIGSCRRVDSRGQERARVGAPWWEQGACKFGGNRKRANWRERGACEMEGTGSLQNGGNMEPAKCR